MNYLLMKTQSHSMLSVYHHKAIKFCIHCQYTWTYRTDTITISKFTCRKSSFSRGRLFYQSELI